MNDLNSRLPKEIKELGLLVDQEQEIDPLDSEVLNDEEDIYFWEANYLYNLGPKPRSFIYSRKSWIDKIK